MPEFSAYVHIPFCAYKCDFCDFTAFSGLEHLAGQYCQVVMQEIADRLAPLPAPVEVNSVYFGGGTPGIIDPDFIGNILSTLRLYSHLSKTAEITLETTPQEITAGKLCRWLDLGINRLSIGVQSLNDQELQAIGRDHTSKQALDGLTQAASAGFTNINTDLMYGLPGQTLASWDATLTELLAFKFPHLSAYCLQLAVNSPLTARYPRESPSYPDEGLFVELYRELIVKTSAVGLLQYEISNFSRPGFESRHNLSYWSNDEYLAFGVGAHRYVDSARSSNWRSLKRYMQDWLGNESYEVISPQTRTAEAIMLGLRMCRGIHLDKFKQQYGLDLSKRASFDSLLAGKLLNLQDGWLCLSQRGQLVSNLVIAELI